MEKKKCSRCYGLQFADWNRMFIFQSNNLPLKEMSRFVWLCKKELNLRWIQEFFVYCFTFVMLMWSTNTSKAFKLWRVHFMRILRPPILILCTLLLIALAKRKRKCFCGSGLTRVNIIRGQSKLSSIWPLSYISWDKFLWNFG